MVTKRNTWHPVTRPKARDYRLNPLVSKHTHSPGSMDDLQVQSPRVNRMNQTRFWGLGQMNSRRTDRPARESPCQGALRISRPASSGGATLGKGDSVDYERSDEAGPDPTSTGFPLPTYATTNAPTKPADPTKTGFLYLRTSESAARATRWPSMDGRCLLGVSVSAVSRSFPHRAARVFGALRALTGALVSTSVLFAWRSAWACGAAYPGGPMVCTLDDAPSRRAALASPPPRVRLFASYAWTSTTILFSNDRRADLVRNAAFAGVELPLRGGMLLRFGSGAIANGSLRLDNGARKELGAGPTLFFGFGIPIVQARGAIPFVQGGATLGATRTITRGDDGREAPGFTAFDLRAAVTAGWNLGGWFVPFFSARAFGGPIFYRYEGEAVRGTDLYKYQLAGGLAVSLFRRAVDLFVEGVPLGERGFSAGVGTTF